jgi:hypothetical protein
MSPIMDFVIHFQTPKEYKDNFIYLCLDVPIMDFVTTHIPPKEYKDNSMFRCNPHIYTYPQKNIKIISSIYV